MSQWVIPDVLKFEVVRVLGFPDVLSSASIQAGYPNYNSELAIYQPYSQLMNKLIYLANAPIESVRIFGAEHPSFSTYYAAASYAIDVTTPSQMAMGATVSLVVNGASQGTITTGPGETPTTLGVKIAEALSTSPTGIPSPVLAASVAGVVTAYAVIPGKVGNGITIMAVSSDPSILLNGEQMSAGATSMGSDPPGEYLFDESLIQPVWGYLPIIRVLQNDILAARQDLLVAKAEEVTFRLTEVPERAALCDTMRRKLADALAVPLDPDIAGNRRRRGYGRTRVL